MLLADDGLWYLHLHDYEDSCARLRMLQMYSRAEVPLPLSMLIRLLEGFEFDWHRLLWSACVPFIHHARPAIGIEEYELNIFCSGVTHLRYDFWTAQAIWAGSCRGKP